MNGSPSPMNAPSANHTLPSLPHVARRALRIAVLAPPWIPVPPPAYGGIEAVVASRYDATVVAEGYEAVYHRAIRGTERRTPRFARNGHALPRRDAAAERATHRLAPASTLQPAG
jgi:hypothetical protein